jgi:tyrosinase
MPTITRKNAWNKNGTFDNPDLLWYAKGVQTMQSRELSDPTSWWFFGAIHGQYIVDGDDPGTPAPKGYPNWADIPAPPKVPTTPLPTKDLIATYWDQCQHGGWFFPPWHRGYLFALENVLRAIVKGLGGPEDWALPYWNYFGPGEEYKIPPAFTVDKLPDGTANPLLVKARYGPNGDGNIFIPISSWNINQDCQQDTDFTGDSGYYGGGETGFDHFDNNTGDLEQNPHNLVHGAVGGKISDTLWGLMSDPGLAALDPIFYLHHSNIDRLWAAWNAAGKTNPTDVNWLNGPTAKGDRKFVMPNPDKSPWEYTPKMVNTISQLNYTYDDLSSGAPALVSKNMLRLSNLGVKPDAKQVKPMPSNTRSELVGANSTPLALTASGARTTVKLDPAGWNKVANSLKTASETHLPDEVYLVLEGVKGDADANVYSVSVNHHYAGHISLFGLRIASRKNGPHGGAGLTIKLDISRIIDQLHLGNALDADSLDVLIQPTGTASKGGECTIQRVSIYRKVQN